MKIGDKIKELRLKKGMSQKDLAEKLNVQQVAIHYWETNQREPSLDTIKKICDIFNMTYNMLLSDDIDSYVGEIVKDFSNNHSSIPVQFDGTEYTEYELQQIKDFADFVKSKREDIPFSMDNIDEVKKYLAKQGFAAFNGATNVSDKSLVDIANMIYMDKK